MMRKVVFIYLISFLSFMSEISAQDQVSASYVIRNGEVIFTFHSKCLDSKSADCLAMADFEDLDLKQAIANNNFDACLKEGWVVKKIGKDVYEMHRSLDDYREKLDYGDVFMIDAHYWKAPFSQPDKSSKNYKPDDIISQARVNARGNVTFYLKGYAKAKEVILSGSFNQWKEHDIKMVRAGNDGWQIKMSIPPGLYEYKFIVDGEWMHDPANKATVRNQYHTLNSILSVGQKVNFTLPGHNSAKKVILAGSFNNWNEQAIKMSKTSQGWKYSLELPPGKHFYKFIVDGMWITDPTNVLKEINDGNENSVVVVRLY